MLTLPKGIHKARLGNVKRTSDADIPATIFFATHPDLPWTSDFQSLRHTAQSLSAINYPALS